MTTNIKEADGARTIELAVKDGIVYFDGGEHSACFAFDRAILLHALERELGVAFLDRI